MTLHITHTMQDGTTLTGLTKAEAGPRTTVNEILKSPDCMWKFSGREQFWYQRQSHGQQPKKHRIDATVRKLQELGYTVEVSIDTTPRDMATAEQDRADRMDELSTRLDDRAQRRYAEGNAKVSDSSRFFRELQGEPVHNRADYNRRVRYDQQERRGHELRDKGHYAAHRADSAARHMDQRYAPRQVMSRIERLEAELRKAEAELGMRKARVVSERTGRWTSEYITPCQDSIDHWQPIYDNTASELAYWRDVHQQHVADGLVTVYSKDTVHPGDAIKASGHWHRVVKTNPKTVQVEGHIGNKVEYRKITDHRPQQDTSNPET